MVTLVVKVVGFAYIRKTNNVPKTTNTMSQGPGCMNFGGLEMYERGT